MTDKQIIIDGVDVSGCECCGYANVCRLSDYIIDCEDNPNCYYKQLKRKEQECEKLKEQLEEESKLGHKAVQDEADTFFDLLKTQQQLDQLKAENEELERELRQKKATILMNNDHYFEVDQRNKKLSQTITEIKEILLFNKEELEECLHNDIDGQILQKISEVEDESNI